jgi:hypothetical protein
MSNRFSVIPGYVLDELFFSKLLFAIILGNLLEIFGCFSNRYFKETRTQGT